MCPKALNADRDLSGLTASSDTAYYQFLLKLGVIRAPTWGEKWDLYKATHTVSSSPKAVRHYRNTSADIKTRARVPFLSSASSDLDYGFQDGPDEEDEEEQGNVAQTAQGSRSSLRRFEQLRGARSSLVGFTPDQSRAYDALTLNAPIRTSTPVRNEDEYSHIETSPPLPPYSVSDISESLVPDDSLSQRDTQESEDTPRGRSKSLPIDFQRWNKEEEEEMGLRAELFHRTGLMGRCWDVWFQAYRWVQVSVSFTSYRQSQSMLTRPPGYVGSDR